MSDKPSHWDWLAETPSDPRRLRPNRRSRDRPPRSWLASWAVTAAATR